MKDLFSENVDVDEEDLRTEQDLRGAHALVRDELTLFSHPAWPLFAVRLEKLIASDLEGLVNCSPEEMAPKQARVKAHRHLLGTEARLQRKEAELRARVEVMLAPEEDDG